jgi:hypothetical protein
MRPYSSSNREVSRSCKHCPRQTASTDAVAWASGWRWFQGTTQGGNDLDDVLCPCCAGIKSPEENPWYVGCYTCDWDFMSDDFEPGDQVLTTAADAVALGRDHQCGPDIWIEDPDHKVRRLGDFDNMGNLRRGVKADG